MSAKYFSQRVCLSVCLFCLLVCPLAYLENHMSKFRQVFSTLHVAVAQSSSDGNAMCLCVFHAGDKPESKTTHMFCQVLQLVASGGRQTTSFGGDRQVVVLGAKSAIFDCILLPF